MKIRNILIFAWMLLGVHTFAAPLSTNEEDGKSKETAIKIDLNGENKVQAGDTVWFTITLADLEGLADDPVIALYLNNLSEQTAHVELTAIAQVAISVGGVKIPQAFDMGVRKYSIEGEGHDIWSMPTTYDLTEQVTAKPALKRLFPDPKNVPLTQLCKLGVELFMLVTSTEDISISSSVYEKEDILEYDCDKSEPFKWKEGKDLTAGSSWLYLNLKEVKTSDKRLDLVVENHGTEKANVLFDLYTDCPASEIALAHKWEVQAGKSKRDAVNRFLLNHISSDFVYLKLTTDQDIRLIGELAPDTVIWNETICHGEYLQVGSTKLNVSGHSEFYTRHADGTMSWNIVDLLVLDELPVTHLYDTISDGDEYEWQGKKYYTTVSESVTLKSVHGCDSVVTLHLFSKKSEVQVIKDTICYGDEYFWHVTGEVFTRDTVLNTKTMVNGTMERYMLQLNVLDSIPTTHLYDTIVKGEVYEWQGKEYTTKTTDSVVLASVHGCDSVVFLHLQVKTVRTQPTNMVVCDGGSFYWSITGETYDRDTVVTVVKVMGNGLNEFIYTLTLDVRDAADETVVDVEICRGQEFYWEETGQIYTEDTEEVLWYEDAYGCDSIIRLNLRVLDSLPTTYIDTTICHGDAFYWGLTGETFTRDTICEYPLESIGGCDSTVVLKLNVRDAVPVTLTKERIDQGEVYTWQGKEYRKSMKDTLVLQNIHGCDSLLVLHLTVMEPMRDTVVNEWICYGETLLWHGSNYTETGDYTVVLTDRYGRDSVATLHLVVWDAVPTTYIDTAICYGEAFYWDLTGETFTRDTLCEYTLTDIHSCDSTVVLRLNVRDAVPVKVTREWINEGEVYKWNGQEYRKSVKDTMVLQDVHGCDSVAVLHLTVMEPTKDTEKWEWICFGESFWWQGSSYAEEGDYTTILTDQYGRDSVLILHLVVWDEVPTTYIDTAICYGEAFYWDLTGETFTRDTLCEYTLTDIHSCDSTVVLKLNVRDAVPMTIVSDTIDEGIVYKWNGKEYRKHTKDTVVLQNIHGCDSVVALHLTVMEPMHDTEEWQSICFGESFWWQGANYNATGDYTTILTDRYGRDSVLILHLVVWDEVPTTYIDTAICYGEAFYWDLTGEVFVRDTLCEYTLTDIHSCDSVVVLTLDIYDPVPVTMYSDTIDEGEVYTWQGKEYRKNTRDTLILTNVNGCDSVLTLHLTVKEPVKTTEVTEWICFGESLWWNGETYDTEGEYSALLTDRFGRDSLVILHLGIWPEVELTNEWKTIATGEVYEWNGAEYSESGDYEIVLLDEHGCDSVVVLHLVVLTGDELHLKSNDICAGDAITDLEMDCTRDVEELHLEFAAGSPWRDTVVLMPGEYVELATRTDARAGIYDMKATAMSNGVCVGQTEHQLTVLYPATVLDQHWNDFVAVLNTKYNGGYDFVAFQWYKDGKKLVGETRSYLSGNLEMGAEYSAELTDTTGLVLMTCPIVAEVKEEVNVYPTLVQPNAKIQLCTPRDASVELYNMMGKCVKRMECAAGDNEWQAPGERGIYVLKVRVENEENNVAIRKMVVE